MARKKGLGRGLDALLGGSSVSKNPVVKKTALNSTGPSATAVATAPPPPATAPAPTPASDTIADGGLAEIAVDLIQRGKYQPRINMNQDSLQDLADSIREQGIVQPIVVRSVGKGKYEIIAGERRWRAAQIVGLHKVPCIIRNVPDRAAIAIALIENIQRENLNPMEESRSLQRLIDEFKMTHQQAAEAVGRSRTGVTNLLRLQELDERVMKLVEDGRIEMGHARSLLSVKGNGQYSAAMEVVAKGLSVRETETLVRGQHNNSPKASKASIVKVDPDIRRLQDELCEKFGAEVQIQHSASGKGKLLIKYNSSDELDGILAKIK